MIGLPRSNMESERMTAQRICDLGAAACRIYPTVVFRDTPLFKMLERGEYHPPKLSDAVTRSAEVLKIFLDRGVDCLRIGLCATEGLTSSDVAVAGANHPALGELVWNELYYQKLYTYLKNNDFLGKALELSVSNREVSKLVGQNRSNLERLLCETKTIVKKVKGVSEENHLSARLWSRN